MKPLVRCQFPLRRARRCGSTSWPRETKCQPRVYHDELGHCVRFKSLGASPPELAGCRCTTAPASLHQHVRRRPYHRVRLRHRASRPQGSGWRAMYCRISARPETEKKIGSTSCSAVISDGAPELAKGDSGRFPETRCPLRHRAAPAILQDPGPPPPASGGARKGDDDTPGPDTRSPVQRLLDKFSLRARRTRSNSRSRGRKRVVLCQTLPRPRIGECTTRIRRDTL